MEVISMSDGPHRSLPMRKPWKVLAMRGDKLAYDEEQIAEAATNALASDFNNEVQWPMINALKAVFTGRNNSLGIREIALQELENARDLAAGSVIAMNAVAYSIVLINEGKFGLDAFHEAIGLAVKMRGFANARSVEEHYIRESNQRRAGHMSERLHSAISSLHEIRLGSALTSTEADKTKRLKKRTEIDEGVPL